VGKQVNLRWQLGVDVTVSIWETGGRTELLIQKPSGQARVQLRSRDFVDDSPVKRRLEAREEAARGAGAWKRA
jgi:hypothetical protein